MRRNAPRRQEPHRAQVDLAIAPERRRHRARDFAKAGGSRTMVSNRSRARSMLPQRLEDVRLPPFDVGQCVERRVGRAALQRLLADIQRQHAERPAGQVQGEGAVIGETVQRPAARQLSVPARSRLGR